MAMRFAGVVLLTVLLATAQSIAAIDGSPEPPPPVVLEIDYDSLTVDTTGNDTTIAEYPGTVTTNYPGLTIHVAISAYVGNYTTTVVPENMTITGMAEEDFVIKVIVPGGQPNNTTQNGRFTYTVLITYPGHSTTFVSSGSLTLGIVNREYVEPGNEHSDPTNVRTGGADGEDKRPSGTMMGYLLMAIIVIVVITTIYLLVRTKLRPPKKSKKVSKQRSKRRKKGSRR